MFAFNPNKYRLNGEPSRVAFTTSGDFLSNEMRRTMSQDEIKQHNLGVDFEKSAQVIPLVNIETGQAFKIYNTHPGLTNDHRLACMDILGSYIRRDVEEHPELNIILSGDFNQFDMESPVSCVLEAQVQKIKDMGLDYVSQSLLDSGQGTTFFADPYDLMRHLSKEQQQKVFAFKDSLREMKKLLQERNIELSSDHDFMQKVSEFRSFYQKLNQQLIEQGVLRLSTVLDGIAIYGPAFQAKNVKVGSDTWLNNSFFKVPHDLSKADCDKLFRESERPLPSDHLGLAMVVTEEDDHFSAPSSVL